MKKGKKTEKKKQQRKKGNKLAREIFSLSKVKYLYHLFTFLRECQGLCVLRVH